jgi:hypothetical protein
MEMKEKTASLYTYQSTDAIRKRHIIAVLHISMYPSPVLSSLFLSSQNLPYSSCKMCILEKGDMI